MGQVRLALSLCMLMTGTTPWRLLRSAPLPGAMNMALDDALLQSVADGNSPPVLRLYRWQPAALTLGYAQQVDAGIDIDACRTAGIDVVRRPTGGRAVLHDREVTYAVIAPAAPPFGATVAESYRVVAGILREALRSLHLPAVLVPGRPRGEQGRAVCFTSPAQHELLIAGCKVAGCAQKRRGTAFLQHGSIPLEMNLELLRKVLPGTPGDPGGEDFGTIGWLNRFSPRLLVVDEVEAALIGTFAQQLGVCLAAGEPNPAECAAAARLCTDCYGNPAWTVTGPGSRRLSGCTDGD